MLLETLGLKVVLGSNGGRSVADTPEALRASNEDCNMFETISLRSAGPSIGCKNKSQMTGENLGS